MSSTASTGLSDQYQPHILTCHQKQHKRQKRQNMVKKVVILKSVACRARNTDLQITGMMPQTTRLCLFGDFKKIQNNGGKIENPFFFKVIQRVQRGPATSSFSFISHQIGSIFGPNITFYSQPLATTFLRCAILRSKFINLRNFEKSLFQFEMSNSQYFARYRS